MRTLLGCLLLLCAVGSGACGLALDFDEEGRACDAQGQCLEGYTCVEGACRREPAPACERCDGGVGCADAGLSGPCP